MKQLYYSTGEPVPVLPHKRRENERIANLTDRLSPLVFTSINYSSDSGFYNSTANHDIFANGVIAFFDKYEGTTLVENENGKSLRRFVETYLHLLGAKQLARISNLAWSIPLELRLETVSSWECALNCIIDYSSKTIPRGSEVRINFYEGGSNNPYESYIVGQVSHIDRSDAPKMREGRIKLEVKEGNETYSLNFEIKKYFHSATFTSPPKFIDCLFVQGVGYQKRPNIREESSNPGKNRPKLIKRLARR